MLVQACSFTSLPVAEALVGPHERDVSVQVLLDISQKTQKYTAADRLIKAAIPTLVDGVHAIAHNKVMIIDDETVATGSFNFTEAAEERNGEKLLTINRITPNNTVGQLRAINTPQYLQSAPDPGTEPKEQPRLVLSRSSDRFFKCRMNWMTR